MRSLGHTLVQYDCVLIKRGRLDIDTHGEKHVKMEAEVGTMQGRDAQDGRSHQKLEEAGRTLPRAFKESAALLPP